MWPGCDLTTSETGHKILPWKVDRCEHLGDQDKIETRQGIIDLSKTLAFFSVMNLEGINWNWIWLTKS